MLTQNPHVCAETVLRWHAGSLIRILTTSRDTDNEVAGVETWVRRGLEPPPHTHAKEDEAVFVISGEVEFEVGRTVVRPEPGEWVYLPRAVRHSYRVRSEEAHLLTMYSPGGIEDFFAVLSEDAEGCAIPAGSLSWDNLFDMEYITEVGRQFGVRFHPLKPEAARAAAAA